MKIGYLNHEISRMKLAVRIPCYGRETATIPTLHGSGCLLKYKDKLYFVCCKHSFHLYGNLANPPLYSYDSLCFMQDGETFTWPNWVCINHSLLVKDSANHPAEDLLIYEFRDKSWPLYDEFFHSASILNPLMADSIMKCRGNIGYAVGFPNRYRSNIDLVNQRVFQHRVGCEVSEIKESDPIGLYVGKIDTTRLVDSPKAEGEYSLDGMSGGGVFTTWPDRPNFLIGMIYAGAVGAQIVRFIHATYIQRVIEGHLEDEKRTQQDSLAMPSNELLLDCGE